MIPPKIFEKDIPEIKKMLKSQSPRYTLEEIAHRFGYENRQGLCKRINALGYVISNTLVKIKK